MCNNCKCKLKEYIYSGEVIVEFPDGLHEVNIYDDDKVKVKGKDDLSIISGIQSLIKRDTGRESIVRINSRYFECPNCGEPV